MSIDDNGLPRRVNREAKTQLTRLLAPLYPPHCLLCEQPADNRRCPYLCNTCLQSLPRNHPACPRCALPLQQPQAPLCGACLQRAPIWTSAHALWRYEAQAQWLIQHYKYANAYYLDTCLATLLGDYAQRQLQGQFDAVVPVPMHPRRWVSRGFNQAQVLAQGVAAALALPLLAQPVLRIKNTPRFAAGQDKAARRKAIKGAFQVNADMPERVLIVDDVKTTGATSEELARVIKQAGAQQVSVLVLARTA
ncbi:MAG: phosphoribosyltransferase [Gammaproteobacteria bacterium]|nr:MAG: phosphoribosyltransferase [Gammaproteobacteria bacterium]